MKQIPKMINRSKYDDDISEFLETIKINPGIMLSRWCKEKGLKEFNFRKALQRAGYQMGIKVQKPSNNKTILQFGSSEELKQLLEIETKKRYSRSIGMTIRQILNEYFEVRL